MAKDEATIRTEFVKMMMSDFKEIMKLPSEYSEKLKEEKSKTAVLKTPKGRWEMDVRRDDDDDDEIFFENGWPRFAHDHALNVLDFLVFEHTGNLNFNVVICDAATACEKQFPADCRNRSTKKEKAEEKAVVSFHSQTPYFTKEITSYTATKAAMVNIPLEIVKLINLPTKKGVILRDPRRKTWSLKLVVQDERRGGLRVLMRNGWHDFFVANELKVGDLCLFELNHTSSSTSTTIFFDVQIFHT